MKNKIYGVLLAAGVCLVPAFANIFAEETDPPVSTEEPVVEVQEEGTPEEEPVASVAEESTEPPEEEPTPAEPEEPLNGWQNNNTQYYQDGVAVDGVKTIDGNVYYFKDTVLNKYTGFVKNNEKNNWVFVRNGKSDWKFTGVAKSIADNQWYHAKNGILDWNFTGFSKSVENGKWYVSHKGKLNWNYTGVAKSIANGEWYHAKNGRLDWGFTGFSKSYLTNKWYVSYKGKLNWKYTGLAKSIANGEWYHATKGRLDWGFTGISKSYLTNKWYFSRNGKLDWNYTGRAWHIGQKRHRYVSKGRLITDQTLERAAEFLYVANGRRDTGWTLRNGYRWIIDNIRMTWHGAGVSMTEDPNLGSRWYFNYGWDRREGNCLVFAAIIYEMSRVTGDNARQVAGTFRTNKGQAFHSWCEIYENGKTKIIDADIEATYRPRFSGWKINSVHYAEYFNNYVYYIKQMNIPA